MLLLLSLLLLCCRHWLLLLQPSPMLFRPLTDAAAAVAATARAKMNAAGIVTTARVADAVLLALHSSAPGQGAPMPRNW